MNFRPALAVLSLTLALGACGELPFGQSETAPEAPGHSGPPTVSPVDQPIETGSEGAAVSTAESSTMNTAIFRAVGTEPFWAVTAGSDTAVYERPGQRSVGVSVRRITYGRGVEFIGVMNGRPFTLNLQAAACSDGMSDTKYPFTARISAGGQRMTGCAGPTDTMPKAQVRASSAPATTTRRATPAATRPATPTAETTPADTTPASTTTGTNNGATTTPETTPGNTAPGNITPPVTTPVTTPDATNGAASTGSTSGGSTSGTATPSDSGTAGTTGNSTSGTSTSGTSSGTSSTTTPSTGSSSAGSSSSGDTSTGSTATQGNESSTSGSSSTSDNTAPASGTTVLPTPEDTAE